MRLNSHEWSVSGDISAFPEPGTSVPAQVSHPPHRFPFLLAGIQTWRHLSFRHIDDEKATGAWGAAEGKAPGFPTDRVGLSCPSHLALCKREGNFCDLTRQGSA